jgi:hypothetical protein
MAWMAELMTIDIVEQPQQGRWELPVDGEDVLRCCVDYAVTIDLGNHVSIHIEQPFVFARADGTEHLIVPEDDPAKVAPVLAITRLSVLNGFGFGCCSPTRRSTESSPRSRYEGLSERGLSTGESTASATTETTTRQPRGGGWVQRQASWRRSMASMSVGVAALFVGLEALCAFEGESEVVAWAAFVGFEDERIRADR